MNEKRIASLDGFRFLALTLVILFHYYSRFGENFGKDFYPYGSRYDNIIFQYGYLGVNLFFIISGFVIYFSILKSKTFLEFIEKRLIRLFPPILLTSVITFIVVRLGDPQNRFSFHADPLSFIPSLTFTDPHIWAYLFKNDSIGFIDGAYWSLVIEMKFYFLIGVIYFLLRKKELFVRYWAYLIGILIAVNTADYFINIHAFNWLTKIVNYIFFYKFIGFFTLGIFFYDFFITRIVKGLYLLPIIQIAIAILNSEKGVEALYFLLFIFLFLLLVFNSSWLAFFEHPFIRRLGVISYTVYLLHQYSGIILINKLCAIMPKIYVLVPLIVYAIFFICAELIYRFYELPSKRLLSRVILKPA